MRNSATALAAFVMMFSLGFVHAEEMEPVPPPTQPSGSGVPEPWELVCKGQGRRKVTLHKDDGTVFSTDDVTVAQKACTDEYEQQKNGKRQMNICVLTFNPGFPASRFNNCTPVASEIGYYACDCDVTSDETVYARGGEQEMKDLAERYTNPQGCIDRVGRYGISDPGPVTCTARKAQ